MTAKNTSLCISLIVILCCALWFFVFASARPAGPPSAPTAGNETTQRQEPEAPAMEAANASAPTREPEPRESSEFTLQRARSEISELIINRAAALSVLGQSRDADSVLSGYDPEFVGIDNGEVSTYQTVQAELRRHARIPPPNSIVPPETQASSLRYEASHVAVAAQGDSAWAVYDWTWSSDPSREMVSGAEICSSVFRHSEAGWKLLHEHCSSPKESTDEKQQLVLETLLRLAIR